MKEAKQILICVIPYMISALMMYPFAAIIGGGTDPFSWERADRIFYFACTTFWGTALLFKLLRSDHGLGD